MGETVNPYSSPTAVDQPPPPDCDSFYGTISRTFSLSRRYKFFIRPGELLAGALPGGSRWDVRILKVAGIVCLLMAAGVALLKVFPDQAMVIVPTAFGLAAVTVLVSETIAWLRQGTGSGTLYDLVTPSSAAFQEIDRHSLRLLACEVIAVQCHRGLQVGARRDTLELILEPRPRRPQRIRIELEGMFDRLGIEKALYEAGFPTMPSQWGHGA